MIVCSCNRLSDRDVSACCQAGGAKRVGEVYRQLGCAPQCGRCATTIAGIIKENRSAPCCGAKGGCACKGQAQAA